MTKLTAPKSEPHGYPAFKFGKIDDELSGTIVQISDFPLSQPNMDKDKPPVESLVFEVHSEKDQTSHDQFGAATKGKDWTVWVRVKSQQYRAIFAAVAESGGELLEGGHVTVKFTGTEPPRRTGLSPRKLFECVYIAPKPADVALAGEDEEEPF